jgi:hypothetical protein
LSQLQTLDHFKQRLQHILNTLTQAKTLSLSLHSLDQCFKNINTLILTQNNVQEIEQVEQNAAELFCQVENGVGYLREFDVVDKQDLEKIENYKNILMDKMIGPRFAQSMINHDVEASNMGLLLAQKLGSTERAFDMYAEHIIKPFMNEEQSSLNDIFKEILFLVRQELHYYARLQLTDNDATNQTWCITRLLEMCFVNHRQIIQNVLNKNKHDVELLVQVYIQAKEFVSDLVQEISINNGQYIRSYSTILRSRIRKEIFDRHLCSRTTRETIIRT